MSKMESAINAVKSLGLSAGKAARTFDVPETTLRDRLKNLGIVAKLGSRTYTRAADNPALARALHLVRVEKMGISKASRETATPRSTIKAAMKNYDRIKHTLPPPSAQREGVTLHCNVGQIVDVGVGGGITVDVFEDFTEGATVNVVEDVAEGAAVDVALGVNSGVVIDVVEDVPITNKSDTLPPPCAQREGINLHRNVGQIVDVGVGGGIAVDFVEDFTEGAAVNVVEDVAEGAAVDVDSDVNSDVAFDVVEDVEEDEPMTVERDVLVFKNGKIEIESRPMEVHNRRAYYPLPPPKIEPRPKVSDNVVPFVKKTVWKETTPNNHVHFYVSPTKSDIKKNDPLRVDDVFTPSPTSIHDVFDFVGSDEEFESQPPAELPVCNRPSTSGESKVAVTETMWFTPVVIDGSQALVVNSRLTTEDSRDVSPFEFRLEKRPASPSGAEPRGPLSSATTMAEFDDSEDDERSLRPKRMNVVEKQALSVETQMVKYCPMCDFTTVGHKLGRHVETKHWALLVKPRAASRKKICDIIAAESRKSFSVVPMGALKKKVGPYWDDRCYRSIVHELAVMGRMKVYGGSWNLPGVKDPPNPFAGLYQSNRDAPDFQLPSTSAEPVIEQRPETSAGPAEHQRPGTLAASARAVTPPVPSGQVATVPSSKTNLRRVAASQGLNEKLPNNHPLIIMFKTTLGMSHGPESDAVKNYVANVSRVLRFVHQRLLDSKTPPTHWADLVTADISIYIEYFRLREEIGQTKATTINYMKNLRQLFHSIVNTYVYEDQTFPKGFDLSPCLKTVTSIKLLDQKLGLIYKRTTKQQPGELFVRKTMEADTLPDYEDVVATLDSIRSTIGGNLSKLEDKFSNCGTVNVRSEKNGTLAEKELSSLWKKATCALAIQVLWASKQRSGVAVNMMACEWEKRKSHCTSSVVTVTDHKMGNVEPATIVLDEQLTEFMERYYRLRIRTGYKRPNFFVTNRGEKLVKIYDDLNKTFGSKLSANIFRRMVETMGRDHDAATSSGVAKALQHSESTASKFYRVPDMAEALRRQCDLDKVEHTALVKAFVDKHFEDFFPAIAYAPFPKLEDAVKKILDSQVASQYPSAVVSLDYASSLRDRYDGAVFEDRVYGLAEEVRKAGYTKENISTHGIIDTAGAKKIHFFLANTKYKTKMFKKVVSMIRRDP